MHFSVYRITLDVALAPIALYLQIFTVSLRFVFNNKNESSQRRRYNITGYKLCFSTKQHPSNIPLKEIEVIHRLFVVIAMYCQASSMYPPTLLADWKGSDFVCSNKWQTRNNLSIIWSSLTTLSNWQLFGFQI